MKETSAQELGRTHSCVTAGCVDDARRGDSRCEDHSRIYRRDKFLRMRGSKLGRSEQKILRLSAEGLSARQIALALGKSEETVKTQRRAVIAKLEAENITHATAIAYRIGLIK